MADKKILAEKHIDRIKNKFVDKVNISAGFVPPVSSENYQRFLQYKDTFRQTAGYKMKDLYPDTYQTMTSIPTDIDYSKLVRADGLFEGCAALQSVDGLDLSSAISASHLFEGCTSLTSVKGLNTPNVADFSFAFYDCENLSELEEFDTSKCHDFYEMFAGCTSLPEKFPWTLNMMGLQKHRGKLIFHCSSVKELDCCMILTTEINGKTVGDGFNGKYKDIIDLYIKTYLQEQEKEHHTEVFEVTPQTTSLNDKYYNIKFRYDPAELQGAILYEPLKDDVVDNAKYSTEISMKPEACSLRYTAPPNKPYDYDNMEADNPAKIAYNSALEEYNDLVQKFQSGDLALRKKYLGWYYDEYTPAEGDFVKRCNSAITASRKSYYSGSRYPFYLGLKSCKIKNEFTLNILGE